MLTLLVVLAVAAQVPLLLGTVKAGPQLGESAVNADVVLPALADAAAVLRGGEWPAWNPFARLGEPFVATGVQPLYPGFWPILFLGNHALPWVFALHSALACVLMFRWLRVLPASRFTAFLGAGCYGLGVFYQLQLQRLPEAAAAAWLPLALDGTWRLTRPGRHAGCAIAVAAGIALMFATGARAVPWLGATLCVALAPLNLLRLPRSDRLAVIGHLTIAAAGACLLAAPIWIDALQHAGSLAHGDARPPAIAAPTTLLATATSFAASGLPAGERRADPLPFALFPGTVVMMMLVLGLLRPSPAQPRWPWLTLAALGVLTAFDGPWTPLLHDHLALDGHRPGASLVLMQLGALVLAVIGFDGFLEAPFRRRAVAVGVGAVAVGLGLFLLVLAVARPPLLTQWFAAGLGRTADDALAPIAAASAVMLAPTAVSLVLLGSSMLLWRRLGVLRFKFAIAGITFAEILYLACATAPGRAMPNAIDIVGADTGRVLATDGDSLERLHRGRAPARRVNRTGDAVLTRTQQFLDVAIPGALVPGARIAGGTPQVEQLVPHLAALGQVDVLLGDAPLPAAAPAGPEGAGPPPALPWARMVFAARYVNDAGAARRALSEQTGRGGSVVLETPASEFLPRAPHKPAAVTVLERRSQGARLRVDAGQGRGYLVIAEALAPGWRASLDGEPVPLLAADVAFRAIAIPEGEHEVEMRYAPWSQRLGLPLTALGMVLCLVWAVRARRARRDRTLAAA